MTCRIISLQRTGLAVSLSAGVLSSHGRHSPNQIERLDAGKLEAHEAHLQQQQHDVGRKPNGSTSETVRRVKMCHENVQMCTPGA